jgi:hypothetical protein
MFHFYYHLLSIYVFGDLTVEFLETDKSNKDGNEDRFMFKVKRSKKKSLKKKSKV